MQITTMIIFTVRYRYVDAPVVPVLPNCRPPVITNVRAVKQEDGNITIKWTYSHNGAYAYCNKSRRFQVGVRSYGSYTAARESLAYPNQYFNVSKRRISEYNFTDLNVDKYHRFFVRSLKGKEFGNGYTASVKSPIQLLRESGEFIGVFGSLHLLLHVCDVPSSLVTGKTPASVLQT